MSTQSSVLSGIGTMPAAIGRVRFVGWMRSFSTSPMSLRKYVELETRQNAANAASSLPITPLSPRAPAAAGAANTRTFFTHCFGRAVRTSPRSSANRGVAGGGVAGPGAGGRGV